MEIKFKYDFPISFLILWQGVGSLFGICIIIYDSIGEELIIFLNPYAIIMYIGLFTLLFKSIDIILWQKRGVEQITITEDTLIIEKQNKLFSYKRRIDLYDLEKIEVKKEKSNNNTVFNRLSKGTIKFYHWNGVIEAGLNMPLTDAENIRNKMLCVLYERGFLIQ